MNGEDENQRLGGQVEDYSTSGTPVKKRFSSEHTDEQESNNGDSAHSNKKAKIGGI